MVDFVDQTVPSVRWFKEPHSHDWGVSQLDIAISFLDPSTVGLPEESRPNQL
jgi:hypothetical protein